MRFFFGEVDDEAVGDVEFELMDLITLIHSLALLMA